MENQIENVGRFRPLFWIGIALLGIAAILFFSAEWIPQHALTTVRYAVLAVGAALLGLIFMAFGIRSANAKKIHGGIALLIILVICALLFGYAFSGPR